MSVLQQSEHGGGFTCRIEGKRNHDNRRWYAVQMSGFVAFHGDDFTSAFIEQCHVFGVKADALVRALLGWLKGPFSRILRMKT